MFKYLTLLLIFFLLCDQQVFISTAKEATNETNDYDYNAGDENTDYSDENDDEHLRESIESFFNNIKRLSQDIQDVFSKEKPQNDSFDDYQNHRNFWLRTGKGITHITDELIAYLLSESVYLMPKLNLSTNCLDAILKSLGSLKDGKLWIAKS
jgi:hypothetical protein